MSLTTIYLITILISMFLLVLNMPILILEEESNIKFFILASIIVSFIPFMNLVASIASLINSIEIIFKIDKRE